MAGLRWTEWLFLLALLAAFGPALLAMSEVWSRLDYYSHGYLVPFVALWAAAAKRGVLAEQPAERDPRGLWSLCIALALYLLGTAAGSVALQGVATVAAVASALLALRGAAWLRTLAFPVAYLLFMVPLPETWLAPFVVKLQLWVSATGVWILHSFGVPVYREGNVIELPGGETLFVAEACSGITSIVTLLPLAVFLAHFTERSAGRRAVLIAAVLPLALVGNLVRVLATVLASQRYGAETATSGPLHDSAGLLTYVLGCLALLAIGGLMRRMSGDPAEPEPEPRAIPSHSR